jgi:hypothetical protein
MDYLKDIISNVNDNKWTILFIVFGILIAYSVGKSIATSSNQAENFETRCEKEKKLYENNKPVKCDDEEVEVIKKVTVASASCPKTPDMKDYMRKEDCPDLSDYVHKSLIPDLNKYISKEYVKQNYISRDLLKKNYMRKCDCRPVPPRDEPIQELEEPPCDPIPIKKIACDTVPTTCNKNVNNKKIQDYLDKNKDNMDVSYSTLDDAFCNKKSCFINGLPDGLYPLK